jgi:hypothetical protein
LAFPMLQFSSQFTKWSKSTSQARTTMADLDQLTSLWHQYSQNVGNMHMYVKPSLV